MKKMTLSALSIVLALTAGSAFATDDKPAHPAGEHKMGGLHREADKDGDGAISKDEWTAKGDKMFGEIDANKDGKATKEEMKAHHEAKSAERKERREEFKEKMGERKEKMQERKEKLEERLKEHGDKKPAAEAEKH